MRRSIFLLVLFSLVTLTCFAQQDYVGQFDAYFGYAYLTTPNMNLAERGWQGQFGYNYKPWVALGFDTSYFGGGSSITASELNGPTLLKLGQALTALDGLVPPGYQIQAPYHANTYTITGGPQFNYRHFKYVTLFIHPDIGAMHQSIQVNPTDPISKILVTGLVGPSMQTSQWSGFYGVGGGFDLNVSKHIGLRFQSDWVHTTLFSDLLKNGQYTWRMSASPTFRFGKNIIH